MSDPNLTPPSRNGWRTLVILVVVALVVLGAGFYFFKLPGLSVARNEPSNLEIGVAQWLLNHSVPAADKARVNPLNAQPDAANIRAGETLYVGKCAACHAHDGSGHTDI